jgi:hypothetical protein
MASGTTPGEAESALPVACTLNQSDLATQTSRWARLAASAHAERTQTDDGLRIAFEASPEAESELLVLVAVERDCCRWASWSVERTEGRLVLVISADGEGVDVLHGMFTEVAAQGCLPAGTRQP